MPQTAIAKPAPSEYAPYYGTYVSKVPEGELLSILERQRNEMLRLLAGLPEEKADYRYAPGKWSIKEVIGHVIDAERVFCYRALWFARGFPSALPSFDEKESVQNANFAERTIPDLAEEYDAVRLASILFFRNLSPDTFTRIGTASGKEFTVRALAYIIAGHERHHLALLRERYLNSDQ